MKKKGVTRMLKSFFLFFSVRLWRTRLENESLPKALFYRACRVIVLTGRFFLRNKCQLHAASLTYYTLLSIVPVLALVFGIAKGYGFDQILKERLLNSMQGQETVALRMIGFADSAIRNASGGIVAGVGVLLLIWTAVKLLAEIENSFNGIWGVRKGRSWSRKFSDYLTLLVVYPFLIIILATSGTFVLKQLNGLAGNLPFSDTWLGVVKTTAHFLHLLVAWFIFFFIYMFAPNTKVKFHAAGISALVVSILYLLLQSCYVYAQSKLTSYNAIYGSFAAIPFFLIWLNLGWVITIFGAQLAFAVQNVSQYEMEPGRDSIPISERYRWSCALRIMNLLAAAFNTRRGAIAEAELSRKLEIPIRITRNVISQLCEAGLLVALKDETDVGDRYLIAVPPAELTPVNILRRFSECGAVCRVPEETFDSQAMIDAMWRAAETVAGTPLGEK